MFVRAHQNTLNSRHCLDRVPDVSFWWNLHKSFWKILWPIWHHIPVHQECPCPPRLQEETWMTGGVLTLFLMSDLDKTFIEGSDVCYLQSGTIQAHQGCPCPPRLQEETWRIGGVLTGFLMSNLHKTFRKASLGCSLLSETITSCVRSLHVLQHPRKRLGGQVESWQASWCPIFMKLSGKLLFQDSRKRLGGQMESWQAFWCPIFIKLSGKLL